MNRKFTVPFIISICLSFIPLTIHAQTEFTQKIVAVVNGEAITQIDVDEILAPIYIQYKSTYEGKELEEKLKVAKADILSQLIEDKLILQQAKKDELTVEEKEIDELVDELKSNFQSIEEFDDALKNRKVSLIDLRKRYKEQLLIKKEVSKEVLSKVVVSPTEIAEYYEANKEQFRVPEQVHLRNIFLTINDNEEEVSKKANEIYEQLQKGVEFIELVEKYSEAPNVIDSGDMGFMKKGSLLEEIEETVFNLKIGEFTKPIKSSSGYYLFKVEGKKKSSIPPVEDLQEEIRSRIYTQKVEAKLEKWINKLKESAFIEVKTYEKKES